MNWIIATILMCLPMITGEMLHKVLHVHPEFLRKYVHISAGVFVALLPLLLNLKQIAILAAAFTPGMLYMSLNQTLKTMKGVERRSYGDAFFGIGVIFAALLLKSTGAFVAVVLILGLSDGLAGLAPSNSKKSIRTPGTIKPIAGRAVFFIVTMIILLVVSAYSSFDLSFSKVLLVAVAATFVEAVSPYGSDNLTVPAVAALLIRLLV